MNDIFEKQLLREIEKNEFIKTDELAQILSVSPSTIRRALSELQDKGLITRVHGGAKINDEKNYFPNFSFRSHMNCLEKKNYISKKILIKIHI